MINNQMTQYLAMRGPVKRPLQFAGPCRGSIRHIYRASHYGVHGYPRLLRNHPLKVSMSGKEKCFNNAVLISLCKSLKAVLIQRRTGKPNSKPRLPFSHTLAGSIIFAANTRSAGGTHSWFSGIAPRI